MTEDDAALSLRKALDYNSKGWSYMIKNMGTMDRVIRTVLALIILALYLMGWLAKPAAIIFGILAAIFLLTSLISFCPLYVPFKISTREK